MTSSIEPALIFAGAFIVALAFQVALAALRAHRNGTAWTEHTTLALADFALNTAYITASCAMGALIVTSPAALTIKCLVGLVVLLPLTWLTHQAFARIEARKKALAAAN